MFVYVVSRKVNKSKSELENMVRLSEMIINKEAIAPHRNMSFPPVTENFMSVRNVYLIIT